MVVMLTEELSNTYIAAIGSVPASVTVSGGPDNGYLGCAKSQFPGCSTHLKTSEAISNLTKSLKSQPAAVQIGPEMTVKRGLPWIIGHGNLGFITTGCGQKGIQTGDNTVGFWNEDKWGAYFGLLQKVDYPILTLLSCDTGAGEDGADFLYAVAKRTNKQVRARTGLTYCGSSGITYENGSTWQVATPDRRPNPIAAPSSVSLIELSMDMKFMATEGFEEIPLDAVSQVNVTRFNSFLREQPAETVHQLDERDAASLLQFVDFARPFQPGIPGAMLTAKVDVLFKDERFTSRHLNVYNDRLLQDVDHPSIFYNVAPGFSQLLRMIF